MCVVVIGEGSVYLSPGPVLAMAGFGYAYEDAGTIRPSRILALGSDVQGHTLVVHCLKSGSRTALYAFFIWIDLHWYWRMGNMSYAILCGSCKRFAISTACR